ncbi:MAG: zinc-finger domain-containing protein [Geminicoccaceae bacterium]
MVHEEILLVDEREVVLTDAVDVRCDGGNSLLGHPVEFLTLARGDEVVCGYCGRRYVHISHAEAERLRASGTPQAA